MTMLRLIFRGLCIVASASAMAEDCVDVFKELMLETAWRSKITHPDEKGKYALTDAGREFELEQRKERMTDIIEGNWGNTTTPLMTFYPAAGTSYKKAIEDGQGLQKITVSKLGAKGLLHGTVLLPVSGHTGLSNAKQWALTDTYSVKVVDGDGKETTPIKDVKSLGFVTVQELAVPLQKGKTSRIEYHRSGSGGPGGFYEGRVVELVWDGT